MIKDPLSDHVMLACVVEKIHCCTADQKHYEPLWCAYSFQRAISSCERRGRRWEFCPLNQRGLSRKSKSSHCTVPPLGKHSSVCVCTVSPPDTQGQTQFADGPTPSEKKKKNTQAMLDVRGPAGVWALLQAKEDDGRAQEELKFTQERLYPRETLDSDGTLKVTQSWGSRDKVAPYSKCISCHLIWTGSIIYS